MNTGALEPARTYQEHMFATLLIAVTLAAVLLDMALHREHTEPTTTTSDLLTVDLSRRS